MAARKSTAPRKRGSSLATQRDGRLFAIALLKRIEKTPVDVFCAAPKAYGCPPARKGPQSDLILRAFDRVYQRGTRQALLGFFVVMTDLIGSAHEGYVYPSAFEKWERRGKLQHWRTGAGARHV